MARFTLQARGDADVDTVWERYACPELWRTWSPQIRRVEIDAERIKSGLTGRVVPLLGPRVRFVIDDVDEVHRRWSWHVHVGPVSMRLLHRVHERRGGAVTDLTMTAPLPVLVGYAPPAQLALNRLVRP